MKSNKGFTLIELVVVIVILGILAATALPKFIDFKGDAATAAAQGVAGALKSATAMNYAKRQISSGATGTLAVASGTTSCATIASTLLSDDGDASISGTVGSCAAGAQASGCTVDVAGGTQQTPTVTCSD